MCHRLSFLEDFQYCERRRIRFRSKWSPVVPIYIFVMHHIQQLRTVSVVVIILAFQARDRGSILRQFIFANSRNSTSCCDFVFLICSR